MSKTGERKVKVQFISQDLVVKTISLDGSCNPIATRTRSRSKCTPVSKSKNHSSTPTPKRTSRNTNTPISNPISFVDRTPSPKRTPSYSKQVSGCGFTPRIRKIFDSGCSSREGKVTPLKIITRPKSYESSPENDILEIDSSHKKNTSKTELSPSVNVPRLPVTPKTPRLPNDDCTVTPRTRSTTRRRIFRDASTTPSSRVSNIGELPQTPYNTRIKVKKEIQHKIEMEENDFEDLDSEDEYRASDSDTEETDTDSDYESTPVKRNRISILRKTEISSPLSAYRITPSRKIAHQNMVVLDAEKYFEKKSEKNIISDNVLSKLPLPELSQSDISEITSKNYVKHRNEVNYLATKYKEQFNKWLLYLRDGFNLMFYGLGSKLEILKKFHNEKLSNSCVLRVNGFNSNFSVNEMIKSLMKEILRISCPANINDAVEITVELLEKQEYHVFIIINNIDGVALRGSKKQAIFSKLSESPYVHIIATVDHINSPLLWGNNKMSCLNFVWLDLTTFNSYATEISYQKSMDIENLGSDSSLELLNKVFNWQDRRTKEVFEMIVKDFLNNKHKKNFKGTLTSELLRSATKNLSISSKSALISTLKAFIEHDILYIEHNYLKFITNPNILRSFYNQHFS